MSTTQQPTNQFKQTNAFAMNYALLFGAYWLVGLLCFVNAFNNGMASFGFLVVLATVPFMGLRFAFRFRNRVCGGVMNFVRGYLFSMLLYFYAALLLAAGVYVYFEYADGGAFFDSYVSYFDSPEVKRLFDEGNMQQMTGGTSLKDFKSMAEVFQDLSPVALAANILDFSIFSGLLLSVPTALIALRRDKKQ